MLSLHFATIVNYGWGGNGALGLNEIACCTELKHCKEATFDDAAAVGLVVNFFLKVTKFFMFHGFV